MQQSLTVVVVVRFCAGTQMVQRHSSNGTYLYYAQYYYYSMWLHWCPVLIGFSSSAMPILEAPGQSRKFSPALHWQSEINRYEQLWASGINKCHRCYPFCLRPSSFIKPRSPFYYRSLGISTVYRRSNSQYNHENQMADPFFFWWCHSSVESSFNLAFIATQWPLWI